MIVIVASRWDRTAPALAARWAAHDAQVLTPQDLSVAGWRQRSKGLSRDTAVVNGHTVPQEQITGVLTLLPSVPADELSDITPRDRHYVAAEMNAFLLFWLSRLRCPVLNRPTPTCLSGPHWRQEKWVQVAAQAGIPVQAVYRLAAFGKSSVEDRGAAEAVALTVIGPHTLGNTDPELHHRAHLLADLAQVELARMLFSGPERDARFLGAETFPALTDDCLTERVLEYLCGGVAGAA